MSLLLIFSKLRGVMESEQIPGYRGLKEKVQHHVNFLSEVWDKNNGAGFSSEYSVNDSDETAVVFDTLSRYGIEKNVGNILAYEENDHFRCFEFESDPSISANIHILGALRQAGFNKENPSITKILNFLQKEKFSEGYWMISGIYHLTIPPHTRLLLVQDMQTNWCKTQ